MPFRDPEARGAHDRERYRKRTAERLAAGVCPKCGKSPPSTGRSLCKACARKARAAGKPRRDREKARAAERRRYRRQVAERSELGLCIKCGAGPAEDGRRICAECGEKRREAERRRYHDAKNAGKLYGGKSVAGKRRSARIASEKRRRLRRESGLCRACGRRPPVEGGARCESCRKARRAAERAIYSSRRSAGSCTRHGRHLAMHPLRRARDRTRPARTQERREQAPVLETPGCGPLHGLQPAGPRCQPVRALRQALVRAVPVLPRHPGLGSQLHRDRARHRRGARPLRHRSRGRSQPRFITRAHLLLYPVGQRGTICYPVVGGLASFR